MPLISVDELLAASTKAVRGQGFLEHLAAEIAEEFVIAELVGTKTHGVGKLVSLQFGDLEAKPTVVEHGAVLSVDGNGGCGFILFRQVAELVVARCSKMGIAVAFTHNFSRYSSLYPYTVRLAQKGFVGILANTGPPAAVHPIRIYRSDNGDQSNLLFVSDRGRAATNVRPCYLGNCLGRNPPSHHRGQAAPFRTIPQ
jgi:LDH2 family malate/lactate/ureidoglycolate dehydrogenase